MDFLEMLKEYIDPRLYILIPVLFAIGWALKKWDNVPDKMIPLILGACSITLSLLWLFATATVTGAQSIAMLVFTALVQGILCAAGAVYMSQLQIQASRDKKIS